MKGLLLKDFYSVRSEYKMYGIMVPFLIAFMMLIGRNSADISLGNYGYLMTYGAVAALGLTITTFTYDEKFGFTKYALATTVSRKAYLIEKYVFHLLNGFAGALLGCVGIVAMSAMIGGGITWEGVVNAVLMAGGFFLGVVAMGVWQIGLAVRFDSTKARLIFGLVIIGITILSAAGGILGLLMFEEGFTYLVYAGGVIFLALTIWMFCMSFVWMKKKEF